MRQMIKTFLPIGLINVLCVIMRPEEEDAKHNAAGQGVTGVWRYRPPVPPGRVGGGRK